jgi:hypothetical protein
MNALTSADVTPMSADYPQWGGGGLILKILNRGSGT